MINMQEVQTLFRLASILQWLVIILIFLAGALQISKIMIDRKIEIVRQEETASKIAEYEETIGKLRAESRKKLDQMEASLEQSGERKLPKRIVPQMKEELSKYAGSSVRLACDPADREAFAFAEELKIVFEDSGWKVKGVDQASFGKTVKDVVIILKDEKQKAKATYVFSVFLALNVKSGARVNKNQSEDLGILVGRKD
jgi:hypothetical protein